MTYQVLVAAKGPSKHNASYRRDKETPVKDWIHRTDAVGVEDLEEMARATGLLAVGQTMSPQLLAYTQAVVEQCASIADAYPTNDAEESAAEHIRAMLPF